MHLNHRIGFRAKGRQQAAVDGAGVDHHDVALALNSWSRGMPDNDPAVATVVVIPEGFTDVQVGATGVVKSGVSGDPSLALEHLRKLPQTLQPLTRETVSELAIGVDRQEVAMAAGGGLLKSLDQGLLVVAAQPCGPSCANQFPNQIHAVGNGWTSVDHITAEHQVVVVRQNRQQADQGFVASVYITDDPVVPLNGCHRHKQSQAILTAVAAPVSEGGYGGRLS